MGAGNGGETLRQGQCLRAPPAIPLGHDELLREMDGAGVERCVLVPPTWEADRNDTSLEAARLYPDRFRVMGRSSLNKPESRALMATWKNQPYMLGIRMAFNPGRRRLAEDGTADWFWDAAERYHIPVMAFAPSSFLSSATSPSATLDCA